MWYIYIRTVSLFLINLSKSLLFAVQTIYRTVDLSGPVILKCCRAVSVYALRTHLCHSYSVQCCDLNLKVNWCQTEKKGTKKGGSSRWKQGNNLRNESNHSPHAFVKNSNHRRNTKSNAISLGLNVKLLLIFHCVKFDWVLSVPAEQKSGSVCGNE